MKASFFSVLAALAAFQTAVALSTESSAKLAPLPEGLADGLYAGNINADGTTTWELIEPLNVTAPAVEKRQGNQGVHCDGQTRVNSDERWSAINNLAGTCGNGRFFNSVAISYQVGGVAAFGCNYRGSAGTWCYYQETMDRLNQVSNQCGFNSGGWYSYGQGISSLGYTAASQGFC